MSGASDRPELTQGNLASMGALNSCDEEPISHSGAIQPHGFLLGVDPVTSQVSVATDNIEQYTDVVVPTILGAPLSALVGAAAAVQIMALVRMNQFTDINPLTVVLPGPASAPGTATFELVVHWSSGLLVLEFTPAGSAAVDLAAVQASMVRSLHRDQSSDSVEQLCDAAVQELRELTGYDRVMAYRFAADAHGEVIAEARRPHHRPYLGLHYPASDIPRQARLLYFKNRLRLIADVDYAPVALRFLPSAPGAAELDLGQCLLRSVSPVHLEYLRNMGVAATMTISIVVGDRLWGMLACHHDEPRQLTYYVKLACEMIGSQLALRVRELEENQAHKRRDRFRGHSVRVITAMAASEHLARGAAGVTPDLLAMTEADGAVLQLNGERIVAGRVPSPTVVDALLAALARLGRSGSVVTDSLPALLRSAAAGAGRAGDTNGLEPGPDAAGAIYQSLDYRSNDCVLWLRGDQAEAVRWAGVPTSADDGTHLTPRASFAEWQQTARGTSRPWTEAEVDVAAEFAAAMPELVLHRAQNRLVQLALHDPLTGLANRTLLLERLQQAASGGRGPEGSLIGLLYIDLDGFKSVNDTLGHIAGDALLIDVARRLKAAVRPSDIVARLGGDEFVVLLDDLAHPDDAAVVAQRIVLSSRIAFPFTADVSTFVTVSVGVAQAPAPFDPVQLLDQADRALYSAKRAGRNRLSEFNSTPTELTDRARKTMQELRTAVQARQFVVHYQPIVPASASWSSDPGPDAWAGVEALVRWQHPERGLLEPDHFVPLTESAGLIIELGKFVLGEALRQLVAWRVRVPELYLAVNVSAEELSDPTYSSRVIDSLAAAGLPARALHLELTETEAVVRPTSVAATLDSLGVAGVLLTIDNVGTAYVPPDYLREVPAASVKVGRSVLAGLPDNPRDVAFATAVINLAHEFGMTATAGGVESPDQLACLQGLGADLVQGYLFGKPSPAARIDALLDAAAATR